MTNGKDDSSPKPVVVLHEFREARRGKSQPQQDPRPGGNAFVSAPWAKPARIPVPTGRDLAEACEQYLNAYLPFPIKVVQTYPEPYRPSISEGRSSSETILEMVAVNASAPEKTVRIYIGFVGKAISVLASKLWSDPFDIWLYSRDLGFNYAVEVTPQPDRSMSFRTVRRAMPESIDGFISMLHRDYDAISAAIKKIVHDGPPRIDSEGSRELLALNRKGKDLLELVPFDPEQSR